MRIYNDIFDSTCIGNSFNIYAKKYSTNIMHYISSVAVDKKIPIDEMFNIIFSKIIANCNLVMSSNYILATEKN